MEDFGQSQAVSDQIRWTVQRAKKCKGSRIHSGRVDKRKCDESKVRSQSLWGRWTPNLEKYTNIHGKKNLRVGRWAITHHMYKKIMTDGGFLLWLKIPIASVGVCTDATDLSNRRVPMLVCREGYESGARLDQSHKNWSAHFLYYWFWCSFDYFEVWAVDRTKQGFTLCHFEVWERVWKWLHEQI